MKNVVNKELFRKAVQPLEELAKKEFNNYELLTIYYALFDSPTDKDYRFIIAKYSRFYIYSPSELEIKLIIDIFKHYGLSHRKLDEAFKIRIQKVLAKSRIFPTPAELIVLVKPNAVINIYDNEDRQSALDSRTTQEIKEEESQHRFIKFFGVMND